LKRAIPIEKRREPRSGGTRYKKEWGAFLVIFAAYKSGSPIEGEKNQKITTTLRAQRGNLSTYGPFKKIATSPYSSQ
jgi:hypothetical protein